MIKRIFRILGLLFTYVSPFIIVYLNHAVLVSGGTDIDTIGLIIVLGTFVGIIRFIEHKIKVYEIQDKNKMFLVMWNGSKRIVFAIGLWWLMVTIEANVDKLVLTLQLLTVTFMIGLFFNVLGNRKSK
jgi:hypothetical protein